MAGCHCKQTSSSERPFWTEEVGTENCKGADLSEIKGLPAGGKGVGGGRN